MQSQDKEKGPGPRGPDPFANFGKRRWCVAYFTATVFVGPWIQLNFGAERTAKCTAMPRTSTASQIGTSQVAGLITSQIFQSSCGFAISCSPYLKTMASR